MAENIRNINKQIASYVLLSAALALPTVSSSAATNNLIADASMSFTNQPVVQSPMMFYASPSVPVNVDPVTPVQPPMAFYASPSVPVNVDPVMPVQPPMAFYASPSVPVNIDPVMPVQPPMAFYASPSVPVNIDPVTPVQPPMAFYASPSVPVNVDPVIPVQPPMAFYASPSIPTTPEATIKVNPSSAVQQVSSNVVEQGVASNIEQNAQQTPNPNMKTEGFVNSEYGSVKVVKPFAHFIFK